jgi:hypothetical protein
VALWALLRPKGHTLVLHLWWGACCQSERLVRSPDSLKHSHRQEDLTMLQYEGKKDYKCAREYE